MTLCKHRLGQPTSSRWRRSQPSEGEEGTSQQSVSWNLLGMGVGGTQFARTID